MKESIHRLGSYGIEREPASIPPSQHESPERRTPPTPEFAETYGDREDDMLESD